MSQDSNVEQITKAESTKETKVPMSSAREIGQPRIITSGYFIQDQRKTDLQMPRRLCTFDNMMLDDAVFNSVDVTNIHVVNSLAKGKFVGKKGNSKSQALADFLNYCIHNMSQGTWLEAMLNAATDLTYGFSLLNLVIEKRNHGKYKGSWVIKKLAPRDQKSVYGWIFDSNNRECLGFVQRQNIKNGKFQVNGFDEGINNLNLYRYVENKFPVLRREQLLHFTFNKTNNNPQGNSPLISCYSAYMEKKLIEKYEVVGVSKDLGGAVVLRVPQELMTRAQDPVNYSQDALAYEQLQDDAASLQAGESTYIVLSSNADDVTKKYDYDIEFKGIEGGGKQYQTSAIIDQKRKSIYNVFGAGFLLLGQDSHGSYNLSDNATSNHGFYVERCINQKVDVIQNQLAPRMLAVNKVYADYNDMPQFIPAEPHELDLDVLSKFIQRSKSVGGLTPEVLAHLFEKAGLPTEGIDKLSFDDGDMSRAGESKGSSGTGNSQSGGKGSATNSENSMAKSFRIDGDKIVDDATGEIINQDQLDDSGNYKDN